MKTTNKYNLFDIESFLIDNSIDFLTSGKNIGRGWIGVKNCPFCGDDRYHLGVNMTTKKVSCFVCGESSMIPRFIKEVLGIPEEDWKDVYSFVRKYQDGDIYIDPRHNGKNVIWPLGMQDVSGKGVKYLSGRNFGIDVVDKYKLRETSHTSFLYESDHEYDFRWRIIIPIIMNRRVVSYTGRSFVSKDPKYQHPNIEASIVSTASCIYNYDSVEEGGTAIICEGPTDVWRLGDGCIATMGVKYTKKQLRFLAEKHLKKVVIVFDENADEQAKKLANALIGIVDEIKIAYIGEGDVGDLDPIEAVKIKNDLMRC
jgi:hypothetical protein